MKSNVSITLVILLAAAMVAQCRRWFAPEVNCWIVQEKVPASWEDARRFCKLDGAVLASPLNMKLFDYMQTLINEHNHSVPYFIGTRAKSADYGQKVEYISLEGRRFDDMPSAVFSEIELLDTEQGECLSMDRHGIRAVSCWDPLPYICYSNETAECGSAPETTSTSTTTSAPLPTSTVPPGYTFKSSTGSYYKFHKVNNVAWHTAYATCAGEGASLVVLNDAAEEDTVRAIVTEAVGTYCTWTELRNNRPGGIMDWRTVHGVPVSELFHDWSSSNPNDAAKTCGLYCSSSRKLHDYSCDYTAGDLYFVCEVSQ